MASDPAVARINCAEKILFVFNPSKEIGETYFTAEETNQKSNLFWIKIALQKFFMTKSILNRKHQYALTVLQHDGLIWYQEFTSDCKLLIECLNQTEPTEDRSENIKEVSIDSIFIEAAKHMCENNIENDLLPKCVVRVVLLYGQTQCPLILSDEGSEIYKTLCSTQRFFFDILHLRNPNNENEDETLKIENSTSIDFGKCGYLVTVSRNLAQLFESVTKLLAHPLQRCVPQTDDYTLKLGDVPPSVIPSS